MRCVKAIALVATVAVMIPAAALCGEYEDSLEGLLPVSGAIEGWQMDGEVMIYYADQLWEYINGAAEGFLAYEVEAVIVQDYVTDEGEGLKLEIYDHQTPLMGFGIYAQHRDPSLEFMDIGAEAFGDEYSLQFWKGRYYVKINVFSESEAITKAMRLFAGTVAESIPGDAAQPHELAAFPEEGLILKSVALLTEGVLGRSRFPRAFVGSYEIDEGEGKLYLFPLGTAEGAKELFAWYAGETSADVSDGGTKGSGCRSGMGTDPYHGDVAVFHVGTWAGVVTGFEDSAEARRALMVGAVERIGQMTAPLSSPVQMKIKPRAD
jgi:hypothetical protein